MEVGICMLTTHKRSFIFCGFGVSSWHRSKLSCLKLMAFDSIVVAHKANTQRGEQKRLGHIVQHFNDNHCVDIKRMNPLVRNGFNEAKSLILSTQINVDSDDFFIRKMELQRLNYKLGIQGNSVYWSMSNGLISSIKS